MIISMKNKKNKEIPQFSSLEEAGDAHGVPHQIIITPNSLKNGIVLIRDRETAWYEQIHAADVQERFLNTYNNSHISEN